MWILSVLTYSITLAVLAIPIREMLCYRWIVRSSFVPGLAVRTGFAPFGRLEGVTLTLLSVTSVIDPCMQPSRPGCFGSLLTWQACNTFLTQELCCWKCKSLSSYSHDVTDVWLIPCGVLCRSLCRGSILRVRGFFPVRPVNSFLWPGGGGVIRTLISHSISPDVISRVLRCIYIFWYA